MIIFSLIMTRVDVICAPPQKHVNLGKLLQIESSTRALETTLKKTNLNLNGFEIFFILPKIRFTV